MVFEAAEIRGSKLHFADQTGDVTAAVKIQTIEIFERKIMRVYVDSHGKSFQCSNFKLDSFHSIQGARGVYNDRTD
jgi:hypothetical protein